MKILNNIYTDDYYKLREIILLSKMGKPLSDEDSEILQLWIQKNKNNQETYNKIGDDIILSELNSVINSDYSENILLGVNAIINAKQRHKTLRRRLVAAISISVVVIFSLTLFFIGANNNDNNIIGVLNDNKTNSGEIVLIESGKILDINSNNNHFNLSSSNTIEFKKITKDNITHNNYETQNTTIIVPNGKELNVVLSDGTKVWLNAGSTFTFPTSFQEDTRSVELDGEAYFDVTKNIKSPFIVKTSKMTTKVFGTEFLIKSYKDYECNELALVSGSVSVTSSYENESIMLSAGQGAITNGNIIDTTSINIENIRAIKDGYFIFWGTKLKDIAISLRLWYNIDFKCTKDVEDILFYIKIKRECQLHEILNLIKMTNAVDFEFIEQNNVLFK